MTLWTVSHIVTGSPIITIKYKGLLLVHIAHSAHDESFDNGFLYYNGEN